MQAMSVVTDQQRVRRLAEIQTQNEKEAAQAEENKKNRDFVQLYRANMPEIRWLMANYPFASILLIFLLEHMDGKNCLACGYDLLVDYFGKTRNTIYKAIKVLEENGFLAILKMGTSNVYIINAEIAWTSYENQKTGALVTYANVDGKMLVNRKENMDYSIDKQAERFKALGAKIDRKYKL